MHGVNTFILISFSGVSFSSVASQLGGLTFLNLTLLIYKMGIILYYEGIMSRCISHAPHYIRLLHFNFCIYYKYTHPVLLEIQQVSPRAPLARYIPQRSGLVTTRYGYGIVFSLCPCAPPRPSGASLILLPLNYFSVSLWEALYKHSLLQKWANLNHVLSIFVTVDKFLEGHKDYLESKYLKFCNWQFWTSSGENAHSMTGPEYTEKIIYSIVNQEFYLFF